MPSWTTFSWRGPSVFELPHRFCLQLWIPPQGINESSWVLRHVLFPHAPLFISHIIPHSVGLAKSPTSITPAATTAPQVSFPMPALSSAFNVLQVGPHFQYMSRFETQLSICCTNVWVFWLPQEVFVQRVAYHSRSHVPLVGPPHWARLPAIDVMTHPYCVGELWRPAGDLVHPLPVDREHTNSQGKI